MQNVAGSAIKTVSEPERCIRHTKSIGVRVAWQDDTVRGADSIGGCQRGPETRFLHGTKNCVRCVKTDTNIRPSLTFDRALKHRQLGAQSCLRRLVDAGRVDASFAAFRSILQEIRIFCSKHVNTISKIFYTHSHEVSSGLTGVRLTGGHGGREVREPVNASASRAKGFVAFLIWLTADIWPLISSLSRSDRSSCCLDLELLDRRRSPPPFTPQFSHQENYTCLTGGLAGLTKPSKPPNPLKPSNPSGLINVCPSA